MSESSDYSPSLGDFQPPDVEHPMPEMLAGPDLVTDLRKVVIGVPMLDGNIVYECNNGLIQTVPRIGGILYNLGAPHQLARNALMTKFLLATQFDHFFMVDADMGFTFDDFIAVIEGPEEVVIAEYARKQKGAAAVRFGMGFARVSRKVVEAVANLRDEQTGEYYVDEYYHAELGMMVKNFHQQGTHRSGHWMGEDQAFWHLVRLAGFTPRIEQSRKLLHIGRHRWEYEPQQNLAELHAGG